MKKIFILVMLCSLLVIFGCSKKDIQSPYSYNCSLEGKVSFTGMPPDSVSALVSLFTIGTITQPSILVADTYTDNTGYYHFEHLTNIKVDIHIEADRFDTQIISNVVLHSTQTDSVHTVTLLPLPVIQILTPVLDGVVDAGWDPTYVNTITSTVSGWGNNDLKNLYLARDSVNLYIVLTGMFPTTENTVNFYLDKDYGVTTKTGISDFSLISGGTTGDHLRKNVTTPSSFGADIGFSAWHFNTDMSMAQLSTTGAATVITTPIYHIINSPGTGDDVIEISIPLTEIYGSANIPANTKIAIVAIIAGVNDDLYIDNDTIPMMSSQANPHQTTNPFVFSDVIRIKM